MEMYAELFITAELGKDTPEKVVNACRYLFDDEIDDLDVFPEHDFFQSPRWACIGNCSSYYFTPRFISYMWHDSISETWWITSRSDLKNYNEEIELFLDWFLPHVVPNGQMIGYSRYEEELVPTIIYAPGEFQ